MIQKKFTRITIDMLPQDHKRLKIIATLQGKSIREIVLRSIDAYMTDQNSNAASIAGATELKNLGG